MTLVTGIELVWTCIAFVGVVAQLWLLIDARRSRKLNRRQHGNRRRGVLARGHVRSAWRLLFVHLTFLYAGARALWMPNQPLSVGRFLTIVLFIAAAVWLVQGGLQDRADRLELRRNGNRTRSTD